MNTFPGSELKMLLQSDGSLVHVSLYIPFHKFGTEVQQNPIRLRNLLRNAEERLVTIGLRGPEAVKFLDPIRRLLDDELFWRQMSDGLAIFLSPDFFRYYRLPVPFKELLTVRDRFHVKPILHILSGDGRFYVLALSQKGFRVLQCSRYGLREIDLSDSVPRSFAEFIRYDELDRQHQYHLHSAAPGLGKESMVSHGKEVGEQTKEDLLRYFQRINEGLHGEILKEETAPLILAGVDYVTAIYKQANTYRHVLDSVLTGSPDDVDSSQLHRRAWVVVQPYFDQSRLKALGRYRELAGTGLTSNDLAVIVPAAYYGKVELLFVPVDREQWGTFDPDSGAVELHQVAGPGDEDLLDSAVANTVAHRGTLYTMKSEEMPDRSPLVAVLRY